MNTPRTAAVALASFLCACAPLQQAPLVYVSKIAVGIDLSSTSTESPGVSLTLGYKQVDAAYVPVAVAKPCDGSTACTDEAYRLTPIVGTSETQGTKRSGVSEEDAKKAIAEYDAATRKVNDTRTSRDAASNTISALIKRKAELEAKRQESARTNNAVPLTDSENNEWSAIDRNMATAQEELRRASEELIAQQASADRLKPDAKVAEQILDKVGRRDSYSVYGRFESTSGVETSKASVGLGKVFSTGVASQNLSQGLGEYYKALGMAACYDAVAKLSDTIKDPATLQKLILDCRASSLSDPKM